MLIIIVTASGWIIKMLQISRLSDYAVVILGAMGEHPNECHSVATIASKIELTTTTVSKCLKQLCAASLLVSARGSKGGYQLAYPLIDISLLSVIEALEGKVQLTECVSDQSCCGLQQHCDFRSNWQAVNQQVANVLAKISISQMVTPSNNIGEHPVNLYKKMPATTGEIRENANESS